ncbi:MAG: exodeoxyribonuclease VII small subunit [Kiritimatiellae bacterium]|nr:exodeoxyribonuclease VII small subunit [Kiritimatiellia bacterium]
MPSNQPIEDLPFEDALARLEAIVTRMESGQTRLDDMMRDFEEGAELVRYCNRRLDEIERRLEILLQRNGQDVAEPFAPEEGAGEPPAAG